MNTRPSLLFLGALLCTALPPALLAADPSATECRWAAKPPVIDGKLDDEAWKNAQVIEGFIKGWEKEEGSRKPATRTKARLLWDREYLYFSAEMEDADVYALTKEQDGSTWYDDVFELFFKPATDKLGYYEFEINAANTKMDMFMPSRGSGGYQRHVKERDFHIESAVQVRGTINNWADKDEGWTVEGRIPWRDFLPTGGRPAPGETWMHALCRYDYSAGLNAPDLSSTAPLSKPNFHWWEDYTPLKFVGPDKGVAARVPWTNSHLVGSPEGPLPYLAVPAFPKLKTKQPITIVPEPGRDSFLLIETSGYTPIRTSQLSRLKNDPEATELETLLDFNETVFDLCFHPRFAENGYLYLGCNIRYGEGPMDFNVRILRYTMDRQTGRIDPKSQLNLMQWHSHGHNGAALAFGRDGMLYITSGDGTSNSDEWSSGQDLSRPLAKLLRIDVDHPEDGKPYGIPKDNPFLGQADVRPETWAYGFRNPWRMSIDRATGDLWVGENGQDLWEYARIARAGENYGWPNYEGSHDFHQNRFPMKVPLTPPIVEHSHTDFRSLTGGVVYRGSKFPELVGSYVYGDHSTGQVWAARQENRKLVSDRQIARSFGITDFCETPQGDLLVIDHLGSVINKLVPRPPAAPQPPFPSKLSETGLFTDTAALKPDPALIPYEVNAPVWHDGAALQRYLALPGRAKAEYTDNGGWKFDDGTALVQTLTVEGQRVETRVLLRQENEWSGYTYAWNAEGTDAERVGPEGATRQLKSGRDWHFPGRHECMFCHSRQGGFVLGFSTNQLNRPGQSGENQLAVLERTGVLKFNHGPSEEYEWRKELDEQKLGEAQKTALLALVSPTPWQREPNKESTLLPHAAESLPKLVNPYDESAPLAARARAYLHANCSHCHMPNAGGNSAFLAASNVAEKDMALFNSVPLHGSLGVPEARLVAPGDPARSLLVTRPAIRGPGQMPPLGTAVADADGVALLVKWIASLKPEEAKTANPGLSSK